jgi:hypothetical protein
MFEIIVMVCLAATGEQCTEFKLPDKEYRDAVTCIRDSHGEGAAWQSQSTKYALVGTRCAKGAKAPVAPNS